MNTELNQLLKVSNQGCIEPMGALKKEVFDFHDQDWQCHQEQMDFEGEDMVQLLSELYSVNHEMQRSLQQLSNDQVND
jgi:hypothetical protein